MEDGQTDRAPRQAGSGRWRRPRAQPGEKQQRARAQHMRPCQADRVTDAEMIPVQPSEQVQAGRSSRSGPALHHPRPARAPRDPRDQERAPFAPLYTQEEDGSQGPPGWMRQRGSGLPGMASSPLTPLLPCWAEQAEAGSRLRCGLPEAGGNLGWMMHPGVRSSGGLQGPLFMLKATTS